MKTINNDRARKSRPLAAVQSLPQRCLLGGCQRCGGGWAAAGTSPSLLTDA